MQTRTNMLEPVLGAEGAPATDISWLAIRQPAVIALLEQRLRAEEPDMLAAGLELALRWFAHELVATGEAAPRLSHRLLEAGVLAADRGFRDVALTGWVNEQLLTLRCLLLPEERRKLTATLHAVVWAARNS